MEQSDTIPVEASECEKTDSSNTEPTITGDSKTELKILEIKLVKLKDTDITKSAATKDKETNKCSDDEGEDLPENFFDDFSNKDFMAGLDIVDDWIDDGTPYFADDTELKETAKPARKPSPARRSRRGAARSRRSRSHHRIRRSRSKEREAKHRTSRNRDNHAKTEHKVAKDVTDKSKEHADSGRSKRSKDRKRSADKDAEGDDARRDPEKTKRDIQRDKIRFTKNLEQKVFIEQLKVAETGLVPPGTELDVVLETERKKKEEKKHEERKPETKRSVDDRKRIHGKSPPKKSKSKSRGRELRRSSRDRRERRRSRPLRSRSRSRRRSRESPRRRSRESPRRLSPIRRRLHRSRSRTFSPKPTKSRRSRSLEELYRRNDDLRLRIREKRRERYISELSPVSEPRLSRSPTRLSPLSYASEREVWLRNKYRSRYGRSCSPISSSSMSDHGSPRRKRCKKSSFMEEIQRKLREQPGGEKATYDMFNNSFNNAPLLPLPVPAPAPAYPYMPNFQNNQMFPPAPQMCPNPYQQSGLQPLMAQPCLPPPQIVPIPDQYGGPMMAGGPMGNMGPPQNVGSVMHQNMHQKVMQLPPKPVPPPLKMDPTLHTIQKAAKLYRKPDENKELTKLFEEQKISLSDYLSVSAKPIDPKAPINVHIKVKAISKCQELIRVINERSKHTGRFFPKMAAPISEKPTESLDIVKWKSPLRKVLPMRFNFTTQTKKSSPTSESKLLLINKLLAISGLPRLDDPQPSPTEEPLKTLPIMPAPPRMQTPVKQVVPKAIPPAPKPPVLIKRSSIGVQTDPVKCQICELRKAMQFDDHGCQTVPLATLDECTQVCVEDLNKSCVTFTPRGILKNSSLSVQSISHLTPAQLLQMQREKEDLDNPWGCNDPWTDSPYSTPRFADTDLRLQFKSSALPGNTTSNESRGQFKPSGITGNTGFNIKDDPRAQFKSSLPGTSNFNANRNFPSPNTTSSTQFNKSSFSGGLLERPYSASSFERTQDSYSAQDRFGAYGSDRYSPEQNFNDSSNFMGGNSSRGRGGNVARGFTNSGPFNAPGRPFYGARGHH